MTRHKTTLYLSDDLQRMLDDIVRRTGRRKADVIREALAAYLGQQHRLLPRSIGAGGDDGLAARDSEAWLRTHWHRG